MEVDHIGSFSLSFDPRKLPDEFVEAAARAMAGLKWIDAGVYRMWDEVPQDERDYWKRFAKACLIGMLSEAYRQSKQ